MLRCLSLVYYAADPLSGRRSHWSLFLSDTAASKRGTVFEAQGGLLQMTYGRVASVTPENDLGFRGRVELCTIPNEKLEEFEMTAEGTTMPSSPLRVPKGYLRRDCQDWVADVVQNLVIKKIVPAEVADKLDGIPKVILLDETGSSNNRWD